MAKKKSTAKTTRRFVATMYTTDRSDGDFIPAELLGEGYSLDEITPYISDRVATELATAASRHAKVSLVTPDGDPVDPSVFGVNSALADGGNCVVFKYDTYETVLTVHVA